MTIRSDMMAELTGKSPGLSRRVISWFLLPLCYFGAFISPAAVLAVPFQMLHAHHSSPTAFWLWTLVIAVLISWLFYRALIAWLRFFRQRVFYVEAALFLTALIFAVAIITLIFMPR
jgi:hypothetical protein